MANHFTEIKDLRGYIQSRRDKGWTGQQMADELIRLGYGPVDADGLMMLYWRAGAADEVR